MGNILFVSGQGPFVDGKPVYLGKVGQERTLEEAQEAAKICTLNILAVVKQYLGDRSGGKYHKITNICE